MSFMNNAFPTLISAPSPETTVIPSVRPSGAIIYAFTPSSYWIRAMFADLFGSYSIPITVAFMPSF